LCTDKAYEVVGEIMIPKINGSDMQYIGSESSDYNIWQASFNHGQIEINISCWEHENNSYANCTIYLCQNGSKTDLMRRGGYDNAQVAANEATLYLSRLQNLLKNCGFILDK
jgi:hypothetical protein